MVLFDANMILRYLLNDDDAMATEAERLLDSGVSVTIEVVAEVVYVLKGVYHLERSEIAQMLKQFLDLTETADKELLSGALDTYAGYNLDFVDCLLYEYHVIKGFTIATFDKKLLKLLNQ